ncbi:zinc finger, CCHC-type containing protein [Tanacetum coccineum]
MHFFLTSMNVVYVSSTPDDAIVESIRNKRKWEYDDYVCKGLILNGMFDNLFDICQNIESAKELWDSLKTKYMVEDASSKKFMVSNFNNYKMVNSRPVMEEYNELLHILGVNSFKLGSHLHIEESLMAQEIDKLKRSNVDGTYLCNQMFRLNIDHNIVNSSFMSTSRLKNSALWHTRLGHVHSKRMQDMSKDMLIDMDTKNDLCDLHATASLNKKYFVTFINYASRTRDEVSDQHSYCFNVEDDPKIFDEAMKSTVQDQLNLTKEFFLSRFSMKDREADVILGIRIKYENNEISMSQSHYIEKLLKKFN